MIIPYLLTLRVTLFKKCDVICKTSRSLIDNFHRIFEKVCHLLGVLYGVK